jgi:hypothetical protein
MKASRYNFFAQKSDGKIAFNAFSAALGLFSEQTCNLYERVVSLSLIHI